MIITLSLQGVHVTEHDDLKRLHAVRGSDVLDTDRVLRQTGAGQLAADGSAHIDAAFLLRESGVRTDAWHADFDAMLDYARKKGWLTAEGRVVVHIVDDDTTGQPERI